MNVRDRLKNPTTTMRTGMVFLILASLVRLFVHPSAKISPGIVDAAAGLLYGVSFACLLRSLTLRRRGRSASR